MRKFLLGCWFLLTVAAVQAQDFTRTMTADERAAAGLDKLSPAELAKLKAIVERYKAGEVAVVQQQAQAQVAAHEAKAVEAEKKAAVAEAKAKVASQTAETKKGPSWLGALVTLKRAEAQPDAQEALETHLVGALKSFRGKRSFTLENGQVWQMVDSDEYAGPAYERPVVRVQPGMLGTFWLQIPDAQLRVKVKPIKLE